MRAASFNQVLVHTKQALDPRRLATLDDPELLQRLQSGESAALEAIMLRHGSLVMAAARPILRDATDVEDVFQATFIVLLKSAHKIQQGRSLGSWLFGVAHRLAVNTRCRNTKHQTREQGTSTLPEQAVLPDDLSWREATALLHEELNRMPERLRMPLLLCHLEGKSRDEAAAELGVSPGTIKGLLERGRAKLKGRLEKRGIAFSLGLLGTLVADGSTPPTAWVDSTRNAVVGQAVRPSVQQLAHGVLPMSNILKMTLAASLLLVASLFVTVSYLAAGRDEAPPPAKKEPPAPSAEAKKASATFTLAGKIVGPTGQPLAKVPLFVPVLLKDPPESEQDIGVKEVGQSNADGTFRIEVKRSLVSRLLYARTAEHALAWLDLGEGADRSDIELKLEQQVPITGRILDTEGKPVVGAKIRTRTVKRARTGTLDDVLAEFKRDWTRALQGDSIPLLVPEGAWEDRLKTDAEGRFSLNSMPKDCIVMLHAESANGSRASIYVVTRPDFDPKPYNEAALNQVPEALRLPGQPATLYGPKTDIVLPLGRVIEGVVTDATTGKPVAGVGVTTGDHYSGQVFSVSDAQGRYRLTGVRKQKQYLIHAMMRNNESRYLAWGGRMDDTEGYGPLTHHITMVQGVVVTGKLIDRETGKGVIGSFRAAPLAGNEFYEKNPAMRAYSASRMAEGGGNDGSFRMLAIPGKSVILVQAHAGPNPTPNSVRPFLLAKPDPDHASLFKKIGENYFIPTAGGSMENIDLNQALKVIDIPADAKEFKVDLYLERGKTAMLNIIDADGKPVTQNLISGVTAGFPFVHRVEESTVKAFALDPSQPRQVVVLNAERKLAGTVTVSGTEKGPITVQLQPLGTITGRIVDLDDQPRVGVNVGPRGRGQRIDDLYREAFGPKSDVSTDAEGKFTLPYVLPGIDTFLGLSKGKEYYVGEKGIGSKKVEPSKSADFGSVRTKVAN